MIKYIAVSVIIGFAASLILPFEKDASLFLAVPSFTELAFIPCLLTYIVNGLASSAKKQEVRDE